MSDRTKKALCILIPLLLILTAGLFVLHHVLNRGRMSPSDLFDQDRFSVTEQKKEVYTLAVPASLIREEAYEKEGQEFDGSSAAVCQTDTTLIYLDYILPAQGEDGLLVFAFDMMHTYPKTGTVLLPFHHTEKGFQGIADVKSTLRTESQIFSEAAFIRSQGPATHFEIIVPADICRKAEGTILFDAILNKVTYVKKD